MYTQCSSCDTVFRVAPEHLRQAQGLVRCCLCQTEFNALASLAATLPTFSEEVVEEAKPQEGAPPARSSTAKAMSLSEDFFTSLPGVSPSVASAPVPPRSRSLSLLGIGLILPLLVMMVALPYAYVMREELGKYPRLRPWIESLCAAVGCELPLLRDVARIHILYRDVDASVARSAELSVRATIVNNTGFRQTYPQIRFRFLDPVGGAQASPWFTPEDYLSEPQQADLGAGMPPQEPIAIHLQVADMDFAAMENFAIDLR